MIKAKFTGQPIEGKSKKRASIPYRMDPDRLIFLKHEAADRGTSIQGLIDEALDIMLKKPITLLRRTKSADD